MSEFFLGIVTTLQSSLDPQALGSAFARLTANIIVGSLIFAAFYLLWWVSAPIAARLMKRSKLDETTMSFLQAAAKGTILTIGAVQALAAVGINMGALITSLGIAGLTIGFAARDALSNLISGILIFWDRPFVIGDLVEVGGDYGRVDNITLRSTRIVTVDGRMLAVPNTAIINTTVASYTNFPRLRIDVPVTIGVGEDLGRVRSLLVDLVRNDDAYVQEPAPEMVVKELNDYNIAVELRAWLKDERSHIVKRFELREQILEVLRNAKVDMPFETLQLMPMEVQMQAQQG